MSGNIAITVEGLSKKYRIGLKEEIHDSIGEAIASLLRSPIDNFKKLRKLSTFSDDQSEDIIWALKDVSFEVKKGEVLGIIGKNGAGKSTLLKILSKITEPTEGSIEINGKVASLLEVGTGFHGELTGRENVYLNGTILGMTKKEVDEKFDEIVEFSGVEKFIDTPVKRYSSGMTVRLAFAVAAHLEPEILIIDEVLAVGDVEFQRKCLGKMKDFSSSGRTVLFVSHNMTAVKNLCPKSILLEGGKIVKYGSTNDIVKYYLDRNLQKNKAIVSGEHIMKLAEGIILKPPTVTLNQIAVLNANMEPQTEFYSDDPIILAAQVFANTQLQDLRISFTITDEEEQPILSSVVIDSENYTNQFYKLKKGVYNFRCFIPPNTFGNREYYLSVGVLHRKMEHYGISKLLTFNIRFKGYNQSELGSEDYAYVRPKLDWECVEVKEHSSVNE